MGKQGATKKRKRFFLIFGTISEDSEQLLEVFWSAKDHFQNLGTSIWIDPDQMFRKIRAIAVQT